MLTHDRLFVSSMPGSEAATGKVPPDPGAQVDLALDRVEAVLKAAGMGLGNMRERAEFLPGGRFELDAPGGKGTRVAVSFVVVADRAA
jgi:signal transduction histidine kinase